ncbi:MAG: CoB--CoM heterodisulfide reductase iron-sulfur subunit A family protein [Deltaproteobacteria bacterium]|nr:CoB--CoM heterodisulfide reductase iron-sulfur subunit A family protein [Deltaproteobacteria bacterium]MBW2052999.1 CoB--CoM heterodisulfide reductase iron-sulfur subunit A family protein [Deltaproteobacteria bacterium]MBW2141634.1 CoB--CoM heterodisulfide reductase iron-sulfur subunit A family protein [Deltaproteobacteria bacterium]MBW2323128.1 CoB--CoM heterodisulfide reductase iron-sulfur subunit A family protein [Deltaproteobacteria bacterium]
MEGAKDFDALVLGAGIAGIQAALDLAEQGFKVALVEAGPSIGGKMIQLSKVFPTLDCASCITTPKMAQVAHHPDISIYTLCQLKEVKGDDDSFRVRITQQPRYVDVEKCIGCMKCELACPVMVPAEEQGGFAARKAIYIPFSNAIPQVPRLEVENCIACGRCSKVCPAESIDYFQKPTDFNLNVKAIVLCTGYSLNKEYPRKAWGDFGEQPNLIDAFQMERMLAPTSPYQRLLRPSDGKEPENVAFIQCAGSRDVQLGVPHCSRVCCMYNIKQAILITRELPQTQCTIYCMDKRCFGKGYEQFYLTAKELGIEFINAKAVVTGRGDDDSVIIRHENMESMTGVQIKSHDLVVLSLAIVPAWQPDGTMRVQVSSDGFIASSKPQLAPTLTNSKGIFMAGAVAGPKDIVDTVVEAGAAASEAAIYLRRLKSSSSKAA